MYVSPNSRHGAYNPDPSQLRFDIYLGHKESPGELIKISIPESIPDQ